VPSNQEHLIVGPRTAPAARSGRSSAGIEGFHFHRITDPAPAALRTVSNRRTRFFGLFLDFDFGIADDPETPPMSPHDVARKEPRDEQWTSPVPA